MKILLIGHSIVDHIKKPGGEIIKPGGIYYSVLGMLPFCVPDDEIYLLTSISREHRALFADIYENINKKYVNDVPQMPEVFLTLHKNSEREEKYLNLSGVLPAEIIEDFSLFDGILINMITGFDIDAEILEKIRKNFGGPVYLDVHTLSRGLDAGMQRIFRPVPAREKWLGNVDIVQVNESELITISDGENEIARAEYVLNSGPKILLVTKAGKGAAIYTSDAGGINSFSVDAVKASGANMIGCGDIFGAVFFYSYIHGVDYPQSLILANCAAGISTGYLQESDYSRLKTDAYERFNKK